jgi:hypothetical protein
MFSEFLKLSLSKRSVLGKKQIFKLGSNKILPCLFNMDETKESAAHEISQSHEKIIIRTEKGPNLPSTSAPTGQEYCAYTYSLVKEVKHGVYGVFKVLCTGRSMSEVEHMVAEMFKRKQIEPDIGFVSIRPTGHYDYLIPGGSEKKNKEAVRVQTGELVREIFDDRNDAKKAEMKEMQTRVDALQEESAGKTKEIPDDYKQYKFYRAQSMMAEQRLKQIKVETTHIKSVKAKGQKAMEQLVRQHGNFPRRFEEETEGNKRAHLEKMEKLAAKHDATAEVPPKAQDDGLLDSSLLTKPAESVAGEKYIAYRGEIGPDIVTSVSYDTVAEEKTE